MRSDLNTYLHYFCAVAQYKSFTKASVQLNLSPSALSQSIQQLENRLDIKLLHRNTRSISLTEAGQQLLYRVLPSLEEINQALEEVKQNHHAPSGIIKLTTSYIAWKTLIYPWLEDFSNQYPHIKLDIKINDGVTDIIQEGFDIGIRSTRLLKDSMIATPIGEPVKSKLIASPSYLADKGIPKTPDDLYQLDTIGYRFPSSQQLYEWGLIAPNQELVKLALEHPIIVDNELLLVELAIANKGIAYVFEQEAVTQAVNNNQLTYVLEEWTLKPTQYYLYYPNRQFIPTKLRVFIDFYKQYDNLGLYDKT